MSSNPFDEWASMKASPNVADHKSDTLSTAAVNFTLTTGGWWQVSADVDIWVRGPSSTASTVTASTGQHVWAKDTVLLKAEAADMLAVFRVGGVAGTVYLDRVKGY